MKKFLLLPFACLLFLASCNDTSNQITSDNLAKGKVAGVDWLFDSGTAVSRVRTNDYEITLMSDKENTNEQPCNKIFPDAGYIRFTAPPALGNYTVTANADGVKFYAGSRTSSFFTATSGFVQITAFTSFEIEGLIQANFDDNNSVEGFFIIPLCN